jgi:hypothetical protein
VFQITSVYNKLWWRRNRGNPTAGMSPSGAASSVDRAPLNRLGHLLALPRPASMGRWRRGLLALLGGMWAGGGQTAVAAKRAKARARADGDGTAPPCSPRRIAAGLRGFEGPHPASGAAGGPAAGGEASDGTGAAKQKGIKGAAQQKGTRGR